MEIFILMISFKYDEQRITQKLGSQTSRNYCNHQNLIGYFDSFVFHGAFSSLVSNVRASVTECIREILTIARWSAKIVAQCGFRTNCNKITELQGEFNSHALIARQALQYAHVYNYADARPLQMPNDHDKRNSLPVCLPLLHYTIMAMFPILLHIHHVIFMLKVPFALILLLLLLASQVYDPYPFAILSFV
jgi:hypothetical protein